MTPEPRTFVLSLMTGVRRVHGELYHVTRAERLPADHPLVLHEPSAFAPGDLTIAEFGLAELDYLRGKDARIIPRRSVAARAVKAARAVVWPAGSDSTKLGHEPRNRKRRPWTGGPGVESLPADEPETA